MSSRKRCLLALLSFVALQHASASSRSSSRRPTSHSRRKRRRKHRIEPREDVTDPHDVSSSSPSFLPLVFTDDEREEDILSALAKLEAQDTEEPEEQVKQKQTIKETKGAAKKGMTSVKNEQKEKKHDRQEVTAEQPANDDDVQEKAIDRETKDTSTKAALTSPTNVQPSLTALKVTHRSSPRQNMSEGSSAPLQYPPRPQWTRTQPLQNRSPVTPSTRLASPSSQTMPSLGIRTPPSAYPYVPQPQQGQPQVNTVQSSTTIWVRKFLSARPKDTLLPIPREYLSDGFNLVHLAPIVERIGRMEGGFVQPQTDTFPLFKAALRLILSNDNEPTLPAIQHAAEVLYTLVHARYVISPRGLDTVRRVLRREDGTVDPVFGRCPRMSCRGMPVLPWGESDNYDPRSRILTRAKRYCPSCGEKFYVWDSKTDESAWGPSFCHLFLMIYGDAVFSALHKARPISTNGRTSTKEPSIFGFKVHPVSQLRYSVTHSL